MGAMFAPATEATPIIVQDVFRVLFQLLYHFGWAEVPWLLAFALALQERALDGGSTPEGLHGMSHGAREE